MIFIHEIMSWVRLRGSGFQARSLFLLRLPLTMTKKHRVFQIIYAKAKQFNLELCRLSSFEGKSKKSIMTKQEQYDATMNSHGDDIETATARPTESSPLLVAKAVLVKDRPVVVATAVTSTTPPPPGVADGGVWGSIIHNGNSTCGWGLVCCLFCGCIPAFIVCCNPFDKKRVYKYNGNLYGASGTFVGEASQSEFEEGEIYTNNVDSNKQKEILTIAFVVGLLFSGYVYLKNISDVSY